MRKLCEGMQKMFANWIKKVSKLRESSIYKYSHAVNTISREMLERGTINKPLNEMELYEIDLSLCLIFKDNYFINKNKTGDYMYSNALKWYRYYISSNCENSTAAEAEELKIKQNTEITETERTALVKSRIGQGLFRDNLLEKYHSCIITHIDIPNVLIASHIKPWAVCSNIERLNPNNGLLLSATFDRLFDGGLIMFKPSGEIVLSKFITDDNRERLRIKTGTTYDLKYSLDMKDFLEYHESMIFLR